MANRLRLGVVGLGARWQRFEPALAALQQEVRVQAVYDPLSIRATESARRWRCPAVGGVVELVERDDLDAILVLTGRLGMWPVRRAVLAGKPVYCAVSPLLDAGHADADRQALPDNARVFVALWPALELQIRTVRKRVLAELGAAQLSQVVWRSRASGDPLSSGMVLALLDGCVRLFEGDPIAVTAVAPPDQPDVLSLLLEFRGGPSAVLVLSHRGTAEPACRIDVQTEHGEVTLSLPRRVRWRSNDGTSSYTAPPGMAEYASIEAFVSGLGGGTTPMGDLQRTFNCLDWVRAARRSRAEGRRVRLGEAG